GEPGREIRNSADRGVVRAALEPDLPAGRVAERDPGAEIEVVTALPPAREQLGHLLAQSAAQPDGLECIVGDLDGVVEEQLDAVSLQEADGGVEAIHQPPITSWNSRSTRISSSGS